jgi:hypothetical protein
MKWILIAGLYFIASPAHADVLEAIRESRRTTL